MPNTAFRSFLLDWRLKAAGFWLFDALPGGHSLYLQTQKHVTKTVPRPLSPTARTAACFVDNWRAVSEHLGPERMQHARILEFGAGWDLYSNLVLWCLGAREQLVFDLTRWARPDQINAVIEHLCAEPPPGAVRTPEVLLPVEDDAWEDVLWSAYGIAYRAPADMSKSDLSTGSIDAIVTTSVLEHIPSAFTETILAECFRVLQEDGVMSHCIDYSDHYAHSDADITPYNFLGFSSVLWRFANPGIHYQNRLRHADFRGVFERAGFDVLREHSRRPNDAERLLSKVRVASEFSSYPTAELLPTFGQFVLRKAAHSARRGSPLSLQQTLGALPLEERA